MAQAYALKLDIPVKLETLDEQGFGASDMRRFWAAIAITPVIAQAPLPHGPVPRF